MQYDHDDSRGDVQSNYEIFKAWYTNQYIKMINCDI